MPPYNKTGTGSVIKRTEPARLATASRNNKAAINRQNCRKRALHPLHTNGPRRSQSEAAPKQFVRTSKKDPTLPKAGNQQAAPKQSVGITKECPTAPRTGNKPRARLCLTQNHEISLSPFVHFLMFFLRGSATLDVEAHEDAYPFMPVPAVTPGLSPFLSCSPSINCQRE